MAVYAAGIAVRWGVLGIQEAREGGRLPFTMESALAFHYGQAASRSALSQTDSFIGGPEGVKPFEHLNLIAPIFWGKVYDFLPSGRLTLEKFYRVVSIAVYSLGAVALFFCVVESLPLAGGKLLVACLAGLGYAIWIPSVLRSTGQELMSENFSLPVLWIHFLCWAMALEEHAAGRRREFIRWTLTSAMYLALAWMLWDMIQVYVLVFAAILVLTVGRTLGKTETKIAATVFAAALFCAALLDPYLRSHYLLPRDSYNHFFTLLWYKIKFLNIKPANPALLPYEVRALWVPALHSATWARTWAYCGPALLLWVGSLGIAAWRWVRGTISPVEKSTACLAVIFGILSGLFVRMEVFWVFFAVLGLALATPKSPLRKAIWISAVGIILLVEAEALLVQAPGLGRDVDYRSLNDMIAWVSSNTAKDSACLASYSLSPSLAAYAQRPIILQPKYETALFRQKIKAFEQALMATEENAFYSLCKTWGVRYYVHSKGFYADHSVNSFRYLVGVPRPSSDTNLKKFEINPQRLNCFRLLYQNDKYLVYRVVDANDLKKSLFCLNQGDSCLSQGWPHRALRWAYRALGLNPGEMRARLLAVKSYGAMGNTSGARQEATLFFERMQVRRVREGSGLAGANAVP